MVTPERWLFVVLLHRSSNIALHRTKARQEIRSHPAHFFSQVSSIGLVGNPENNLKQSLLSVFI